VFVKKGLDGISKGRIKERLSAFQKEFRNRLATFLTSAFAFVAAFLWRDAIRAFIDRYNEAITGMMPIKEAWVVQSYTALIVSIGAVVVIILLSKFLKV